jgi:asparagine synthase (glutamine-hydrolysing)
VDSSSVTVALQKGGHQLTGYTVGFDDPRYDERPWARRVSELYDIPLVERRVEAEAIAPVIERLAWHFDEPFNDYSYLPTYYLCREARRDITVALSGDGGDELFAGYGKYQRVALVEAVHRFVPSSLRAGLGFVSGGPTETRGLRRTWYQYAAPDEAGLADMLTLGFQSHDLSAIARGPFREVARDHTPTEVVRRHLKKAHPKDVGLINSMRYLDLKLTLGSGILTKVDRASMAVSLEARPVFLNRRMLDLAAAIPSHLLADRGHSKEAVKRAVAPWLPKDLVYRRKQGFHMPLGDWLREGRAEISGDQGEDLLADLIDPAAVRELHSAHTSGTTEATARLHGLHFLQRWLHIWMDTSGAMPVPAEAAAL